MCFEKVPYMAIYIMKMGVWNGSQTIWDSFQTSVFNTENLPFIVSRTLHVHLGSSLHAHASWPCAQIDSCVRRPRVSLALFFQK